MIRLRDISLPPEHDANQLRYEAAKNLKIPGSKIRELTIVRRSVDARKKPEIRIIYTVDVRVEGNEKKLLMKAGSRRAELAPVYRYTVPKAPKAAQRPVVVGFGPAGMFAALVLALAGQCPLVLERGDDALTRKQKVDAFFPVGRWPPKATCSSARGAPEPFPTES